VCHFVPTSSSWLNLVERWFRELTEKSIRRGSFVSVPDLIQAIDHFMKAWNQNPKPFIWTASVGEIIEKIERADQDGADQARIHAAQTEKGRCQCV
jgi:hypothetical protein